MNRDIIKLLIIICGIVLLAFSCKKNCEIKIPKGVKPIDWVNYNDVYTVFWNYVKDCSETCNDVGRDIKVYGWIFQGPNYPDGKPLPVEPAHFVLISNEDDIFYWNCSTRGGACFSVKVHSCETLDERKALIESVKNKFSSADITQKCYINGKLSLDNLPTNRCCQTSPEIIIYNVDDIYFE